MVWYLFICLLMLYPLSVYRNGLQTGKSTRHLALFIACLILWFFMAMRDVSVGVDTKHYAYVFTQFQDIPWRKVFTAVTYGNEKRSWAFDFESGYRLVNKLLSQFTASPQAMTILNSSMIMMLWYRLISRESPHFLLSIWLFMTLGIYQTEMNVTRNAIAILIVYNGFGHLRQGRFAPYLLICLFASLFHIAALAFIPVYWLARNVPMTAGRVVMLVGMSCIVGILFPLISPYLTAILPGRLAKYFEGNNEKLQSLMVGLLNGGMFFLTWWLLPHKKRRVPFIRFRLEIILLLINLCFFGLNIGLGDASRMAALFGPYLVILIPRMLTLIPSKIRRKNAMIVITVVSGVQYLLRLCINNIGGTIPYDFFW